jgi:hypothetical protein
MDKVWRGKEISFFLDVQEFTCAANYQVRQITAAANYHVRRITAGAW